MGSPVALSAGGRRPVRERLLAACWFGAWGVAVSAGVYLFPSGMPSLGELALFGLAPGAAAAVAGAVVGPSLLDPEKGAPWRSVWLGLVAVGLAHLLLGPFFAVVYWLADPYGTNVLGLAFGTSVLGFVLMGSLTLPAGALAGWSLYLLRYWRDTGSTA